MKNEKTQKTAMESKIKNNLEDLAIALYQSSTLSIKAVGDELGVPTAKVQGWLKTRGIKTRLGYKPSGEKRKEAAQMFVDGISVSKIALAMVRSRSVIYKWLRQEKVRVPKYKVKSKLK